MAYYVGTIQRPGACGCGPGIAGTSRPTNTNSVSRIPVTLRASTSSLSLMLGQIASADDQCDHCTHELIVAVRFATAGREKIEGTVGSSDEAVEAGANKDGCFHYRVLMLPPNVPAFSCERQSDGEAGATSSPAATLC